MGLRATPLACGHAFRAEVAPTAGERVWCHTCFDYRYIGFGREAAKPQRRKAKPKAEPAGKPKRERGWRPTRRVCSSCHLELPVVGTCGDCPEDPSKS